MSPRRRRFAVRAAGYGLLLLGTILYLGPFAIQVATSFKTDADAALHPLSLIASPLTFAAWNRAFGGDPTLPVPLGRWVGNSVLVAVTVTVGRLIIDSMAGYALARLRFVGRRMIFGGILAVMAVPGVVLLIPTFLVLKQLSMFDSYSGMIIPLLSDAVGIMLMRSAFEQIPSELEDAARIDGAGPYRTFASVMLPLVRPALVTVAIISFQGSWNQFTHFLVATSDPQYQTLTLGIAQLTAGALQGPQQFPLKLALATLSTIPIALVYVIFQRYFVRSQLGSGIK